MPQIKKHNIENNELTGASFESKLGFYDEMQDYNIGDKVFWNQIYYECNTAVTAKTIEGDLTSSPDLSTDWTKVQVIAYSTYPSTAQTFTTTRTNIQFDTERQSSDDITLSTSGVTEGEITFNRDANVFVSITMSCDLSVGTARSGSQHYLQRDNGSGFVDVPNFLLSLYHRNTTTGEDTGSMTIPLNVSSGDKIRIQSIRYSGPDTVRTMPAGCNITIFDITARVGSRGEKGSDGDMTWEGIYNGATTYNENEAVEYNGSSFICITDGTVTNPGTPGSPNAGWELLVTKGADGAGSSVIVQDAGATGGNSPYTTINFTEDGGVNLTENGTDIIEVAIDTSYMVAIVAEENASLDDGAYEFSFGNGATNQYGPTIYVPSGETCELVAMGISTDANMTATVDIVLNGTSDATRFVTVTNAFRAVNSSFTAMPVSNGDSISFRTNTVTIDSSPVTMSAWLKYTK